MEFFATDLLVVLVIAVALIASVRVLREDQRATARLLGRTLVIKGPGLVLRIPGLHQRWQQHSIGDRGVLLENGRVLLNGVELPSEVEDESVQAGAKVRLSKFPDGKGSSRFKVEPFKVEPWNDAV